MGGAHGPHGAPMGPRGTHGPHGEPMGPHGAPGRAGFCCKARTILVLFLVDSFKFPSIFCEISPWPPRGGPGLPRGDDAGPIVPVFGIIPPSGTCLELMSAINKKYLIIY